SRLAQGGRLLLVYSRGLARRAAAAPHRHPAHPASSLWIGSVAPSSLPSPPTAGSGADAAAAPAAPRRPPHGRGRRVGQRRRPRAGGDGELLSDADAAGFQRMLGALEEVHFRARLRAFVGEHCVGFAHDRWKPTGLATLWSGRPCTASTRRAVRRAAGGLPGRRGRAARGLRGTGEVALARAGRLPDRLGRLPRRDHRLLRLRRLRRADARGGRSAARGGVRGLHVGGDGRGGQGPRARPEGLSSGQAWPRRGSSQPPAGGDDQRRDMPDLTQDDDWTMAEAPLCEETGPSRPHAGGDPAARPRGAEDLQRGGAALRAWPVSPGPRQCSAFPLRPTSPCRRQPARAGTFKSADPHECGACITALFQRSALPDVLHSVIPHRAPHTCQQFRVCAWAL
ncbi:unnamed protein product, partial [Prorocentrum cordatum]